VAFISVLGAHAAQLGSFDLAATSNGGPLRVIWEGPLPPAGRRPIGAGPGDLQIGDPYSVTPSQAAQLVASDRGWTIVPK
jgi:hypothetical protein